MVIIEEHKAPSQSMIFETNPSIVAVAIKDILKSKPLFPFLNGWYMADGEGCDRQDIANQLHACYVGLSNRRYVSQADLITDGDNFKLNRPTITALNIALNKFGIRLEPGRSKDQPIVKVVAGRSSIKLDRVP